MSVNENLSLMQRWFDEVWNQGRAQTIYDLMTDDAVGVGQDVPGKIIRGPADFAALHKRLHGAFPDIKVTIDDILGADDKVVTRWSAEMTHTGDTLGMPATHRKVRITGITITRIVNGKIVQGWDNWDQLALMQQIADTAAAAG